MSNSTLISGTASIDDLLGTASGRYFGGGYKKVKYRINTLTLDQANKKALASTAVQYPRDWSKKSNDNLLPHLSTLDSLFIGVQLCETLLIDIFNLSPAQSARIWVHEAGIKPSMEACTQLNDVLAEASLIDCAPCFQTICGCLSTFEVTVGTIKVKLVFDHCLNDECKLPHTSIKRTYSTEETSKLLGTSYQKYYCLQHKKSDCNLYDIQFSTDNKLVTSKLQVHYQPDFHPISGIAAAYSTALSAIDLIVAGGQLAQALLYRLDNVDRKSTNNLWMRSVTMKCPTPIHSCGPFSLAGRILRTRIIKHNNSRWRIAECDLTIPGVTDLIVTAKLSHQLPELADPVYS